MARLTLEKTETAVRSVLSQLFAAGRVDLAQLANIQRGEYVKHVAGLAALSVATMPAVQEALAIARPSWTAAERQTAMVQAVAQVFGLPALKEPEHDALPVN
jgi:hypothetical protein